MSSAELFSALNAIRLAASRNKPKEEIEALFAQAEQFLLNAGVSAEEANTQLTEFRGVFVEKSAPDVDNLAAQISNALPQVDVKRCNLGVYRSLLPYAKLMHLLEKNGIPEEHAYKLAVVFDDPQKAFAYLDRFKAQKQPMHDANLFALPAGEWDAVVWRKLCAKYMPDEVFRKEILPNASELEPLIKQMRDQKQKQLQEQKQKQKQPPKNALIKQIADITKQVEAVNVKFKKLDRRHGQLSDAEKSEHAQLQTKLLELRSELTELGVAFDDQLTLAALFAFKVKRDTQASGTLQYFLKNGLTQKDYAKFVELDRSKASVNIPDIKIDGEQIGQPGFYLMKVDVADDLQAARAACLGKLTDCCQSLSGEAGEPCVIHGLTSPNGGFYVLCKGDSNEPKIDDKVMGQCWAWRSKTGAIVFDSIEVADKKDPDLASSAQLFYQALGKNLVTQGHTSRVVCGDRSGISSSVGVASVLNRPEVHKDYQGYSDSQRQNVIYDSLHPYYLYGIDDASTDQTIAIIEAALDPHNEAPLVSNEAFAAMINWAVVSKRTDVLLKAKEFAAQHNQQEKYATFLSGVQKYCSNVWYDEIVEQFIADVDNHNIMVDLKDPKGLTFLSWAASNGHKDLVLKLLEKGANIHESKASYETALTLAAKHGHRDIVLALLENGADINDKDAYGFTPLMLLILSGQKDSARELIAMGAGINKKSLIGGTALQYASNLGYTDVVLDLLDNGAKFDEKSSVGISNLIFAVKGNRKDIVAELLESGVDINGKGIDGKTAFLLAVEYGHKEIALFLLENGANIESSLQVALLAGKTDMALTLIEKGANIHERDKLGQTPLMLAAKQGTQNVVLALLEKGANIDEKNHYDQTALQLAEETGKRNIVDLLIKKGAKENEKIKEVESAFLLAIEAGKIELAMDLLENGSSIDEKDKFGDTALLMVIKQSDQELALALLEKGPSLEEKDQNGKTALILAAERGFNDVVVALLEKGANINEIDNTGMTALMWSATFGHKSTVTALLEKGAELDQKSNDGSTALLCAIKRNRESIALALIENGINLDEQDNAGKTALIWAVEQGDKSMARALVEKGAKLEIKDKAGKSALDYAKPSLAKSLKDIAPTATTIARPKPLRFSLVDNTQENLMNIAKKESRERVDPHQRVTLASQKKPRQP